MSEYTECIIYNYIDTTHIMIEAEGTMDTTHVGVYGTMYTTCIMITI